MKKLLAITTALAMLATVGNALTMKKMTGDVMSGTMMVTDIEDYDAVLATWNNGQCPAKKWKAIKECGTFAILFTQSWLMIDYEMKEDGTGYRMFENSTGLPMKNPIKGFLGVENFVVKTKNDFRIEMADEIKAMLTPAYLNLVAEFLDADGYYEQNGLFWLDTDEPVFEADGENWKWTARYGWVLTDDPITPGITEAEAFPTE